MREPQLQQVAPAAAWIRGRAGKEARCRCRLVHATCISLARLFALHTTSDGAPCSHRSNRGHHWHACEVNLANICVHPPFAAECPGREDGAALLPKYPPCIHSRKHCPTQLQVKEDEPWYCYLNPNENKATCSASEDVSSRGRMRSAGSVHARLCCCCGLLLRPAAAPQHCSAGRLAHAAHQPAAPQPALMIVQLSTAPVSSSALSPRLPALQDYNEATMVELGPSGVDLDEAEQNRFIREQLTGKLLASSGLPMPVGAALPPLPVVPAGGKGGKGGRGRG